MIIIKTFNLREPFDNKACLLLTIRFEIENPAVLNNLSVIWAIPKFKIDKWDQMVVDWEKDPACPNPYEDTDERGALFTFST